MPGHPSATIEAWAVPVQGLQMLDHTYVVSSCGYRWGCFGADSGGSIVVPSGTGDSNIAECLSHPRAGRRVYAGLTYFVHGVCHQASNRVMEPTGRTLSSFGARVRGYHISLIRYGIYRLAPWNREAFCYGAANLLAVDTVASGPSDDRQPNKAKRRPDSSWGSAHSRYTRRHREGTLWFLS